MKLTKQKNKILEMMGLPKSTIKDKFKSHNRKQIDESLHKVKHFYGFIGLPNYWVDDNDKSYSEKYFNDKEYEDKIFDNFFDMDKEFGHENSLFGTRGLEPRNPNRTSKSFNTYVERFGPMVVRVLKKENIKESIKRILKESVKEKLETLLNKKGLAETLNILRIDIDKLSDMMQTSIEELLKEYNPFNNIFTEEEFKKELNDSIIFLTNKHIIDHLKHESLDNILKFLISNIIDSFHDRLINFDTEDWIIPNTPELLKMTYGDKILNHPKYITWVKTIKNK